MMGYRARMGAALAMAAVALLNAPAAWAVAQEPSISGDKWAAYGIIGGLIVVVLLFVFASVGIAKSDAAYERGHHKHNEVPGLPMLGDEEDDKD